MKTTNKMNKVLVKRETRMINTEWYLVSAEDAKKIQIGTHNIDDFNVGLDIDDIEYLNEFDEAEKDMGTWIAEDQSEETIKSLINRKK